MAEAEATNPVRIIVAEDDPATRVLITRQLRRAGYRVVSCDSAREALELLTRDGADVVVSDWKMPGMDGLELCRAIRELTENDALPFVYFILLTAYADQSSLSAAFEAGADDYLAKPYTEAELVGHVRAAVRIAGLQRELTRRRIDAQRVNAEMAILNRRLQRLATTDGLTGLGNRRFLCERMAELWAIAQRHDRPLAFVMMDIDHFKPINDAHGHEAGDRVLADVAAVIRSQARASDVCARFGGEEFAVLCPETDASGAARLAERIRSRVAEHPISFHDTRLAVTISGGVSERHAQHADFEALIAEADQALYAAKRAGRDCVCVSRGGKIGEPIARGAPGSGAAAPTSTNAAHPA